MADPLNTASPAPRPSLTPRSLASLSASERREFLASLSDEAAANLLYDWAGFWARAEQLPPDGEWTFWLLLAGRGFGKTRTGAEWVRQEVDSGRARNIALVGPTVADVRKVMVQGVTGIMRTSPPWNRPIYEPSNRQLTWPNGAIAVTFSADEPERLRGPQHDAAWCDELGAWRYCTEAWDQLNFGLRLGDHPRCLVTTTPRPNEVIRALIADKDATAITRGSTYDNRANLPKSFFDKIIAKYEGTRLGRQELLAELLDDVPGALWQRRRIDETRWPAAKPLPQMRRIVVAIDPAVTSGEDADETGIIVAGVDYANHGYVLEDLSGRYAPHEWAQRAIKAYVDHKADRIIAETNNGGEMVGATVRMVAGGKNIPFRAVHASRGKAIRAEPVAALYEQGRVHHVGAFPALEDQMCAFTSDFDRERAGISPDRLDALVWAFTELIVEGNDAIFASPVIVSAGPRNFPGS